MNMPREAPAYDAFGDVAATDHPRVSSTKRMRNLTVAVFWSIALMLIAGRVYQHNLVAAPQAGAMAMASR